MILKGFVVMLIAFHVLGCFGMYSDVFGCFWMFLPGRPLSRLPCILLGCSRSNTSNSRTPARLVRSHREPEKVILVIQLRKGFQNNMHHCFCQHFFIMSISVRQVVDGPIGFAICTLLSTIFYIPYTLYHLAFSI